MYKCCNIVKRSSFNFGHLFLRENKNIKLMTNLTFFFSTYYVYYCERQKYLFLYFKGCQKLFLSLLVFFYLTFTVNLSFCCVYLIVFYEIGKIKTIINVLIPFQYGITEKSI